MTTPTFLSALSRGHYTEGAPMAECSYCLFYAPLSAPVLREHIEGDETQLILELTCCGEVGSSDLRLRQVGTNLIIEEGENQNFCHYLSEKQSKYMGQVILHAIRFKMNTLSILLGQCADDMKDLENQLDNCIDNRGTYQILDFRRKYTEYGSMIISMKDILTRIDKGYYPMQMQSSYVLQGEVLLDFQFLESRYDLVKNTLIKDLDTYTSIINNNINRNARLLSIISLGGVVLNFIFGSFLYTNPILGIVGGVLMGGVSAGAALHYHRGNRNRNTVVLSSQSPTPPLDSADTPIHPSATEK